jgi:hypothetical protein
VIISASRRTDIPAFYSAWLMNRIRAGYCLVPNPFNAKQIGRISLTRQDVDAFVFWSKNPAPMLQHLAELSERGFIYYFQFTLNDYPLALEPLVPAIEQRIAAFLDLAQRLGSSRIVWRYDPIIITPATGYDFHAVTFDRLARALNGATQRVVVSVVDLYRKTGRRMKALSDDRFTIDPDAASSTQMLDLLRHISSVAQGAGMAAFSCAEEHDFTSVGVRPGRCIDGELISTLGGQVLAKKDPGQRAACGCVISRDIGMIDTCAHGCTYCYSTGNDQLARQRHAQHDPTSSMLFLGHPLSNSSCI